MLAFCQCACCYQFNGNINLFAYLCSIWAALVYKEVSNTFQLGATASMRLPSAH